MIDIISVFENDNTREVGNILLSQSIIKDSG